MKYLSLIGLLCFIFGCSNNQKTLKNISEVNDSLNYNLKVLNIKTIEFLTKSINIKILNNQFEIIKIDSNNFKIKIIDEKIINNISKLMYPEILFYINGNKTFAKPIGMFESSVPKDADYFYCVTDSGNILFSYDEIDVHEIVEGNNLNQLLIKNK